MTYYSYSPAIGDVVCIKSVPGNINLIYGFYGITFKVFHKDSKGAYLELVTQKLFLDCPAVRLFILDPKILVPEDTLTFLYHSPIPPYTKVFA